MKKKRLFAHKACAAAICLACTLALSACGSKNKVNENKDPLTGEDMTGTQEGSSETGSDQGSDMAAGDFSEFDAMIGDESTDPNSIMDYINTNIVSAGVSDVEHFFTGLLGFGDDIREMDFTRLEDSRQYMPEDMIAFMDLMKLENEKPSMVMSDTENRKVINLTLSEMLERAVLFEQHLQKYPDNVTTEAASKIYEELATNAISGGYDRTEGIPHYYKGDTDDQVDQDALQFYQQFAQANAASNLGRIVGEYVNLLQENQFKINDTMEAFYKGLQARLDVGKWANATQNTDTSEGSTGTSTSGTNGTGTNTNSTTGTGTNTNGTTGTGTNTNSTTGNGTNINNAAGTGSETNTEGTGDKSGSTNDKNTKEGTGNNNTANSTGTSDTVIQGTVSR